MKNKKSTKTRVKEKKKYKHWDWHFVMTMRVKMEYQRFGSTIRCLEFYCEITKTKKQKM